MENLSFSVVTDEVSKADDPCLEDDSTTCAPVLVSSDFLSMDENQKPDDSNASTTGASYVESSQSSAVPIHRGRSTAVAESQGGLKATVASRFLSATRASLGKERSTNSEEISSSNRDASASSRSRSTERRLTVPVGPKLRSVSRSRERPLSTEEREMREVEQARAAEEERMKRNKQFMISNKARSSVPVNATVRSTKELTIPSTPNAHLSKRLGDKKYSTTSSPRSNEIQSRPTTAPPSGTTQPEPFAFRTDARAASRSTVAPTEAIPTAGEAAMQFQNDPRSHYVPNVPLQLTEPSSPKLRTKVRAQSTGRPRPKSFQEKEEEAMEEASKHVFKFKPVDKRIFSSMGELGVPKVPAKACTNFDEFTFRYEERAASRQQQRDQQEEPAAAFKALPMPDFSKAALVVNVQHVAPVTRPVSPKLSGGQRASSAPARRQRPHHDEVKRMKEQQEAEEREQRKRHLSLTEPQAFNFRTEERGKAFQTVLEHRIHQEQEEERRQREFKAQPVMKTIEKPFVPEPCKQELTEFQEFHLVTDSRHEASEARLRAQQEREKQLLEEESKFHARPVPKSIEAGKGFVPHLEEKEPTKPLKIALQSDERAEKRRLFEEELARRQKLLEAEKARIREMESKKENEEVQQLRRKPVSEGGLCFKAAPVFKPRSSGAGASVRASVAKTLGISAAQDTDRKAQPANDDTGFEAGL